MLYLVMLDVLNQRSLTLLFSILVYTREGRSLRCCTNCFWVNYTVVIQVTKLCAYPLNKQLHALSSALYQKFATFMVLMSFCFFKEVWLDCCDGYNRMFNLQSEWVLSFWFNWSRWWEHSVIIYWPIRWHYTFAPIYAHKATKIAKYLVVSITAIQSHFILKTILQWNGECLTELIYGGR